MIDEAYIRERLRSLREHYGMSTTVMAEKVGMEPKWLQNYFRGERGLASAEIVEIMVVFGLKAEFFLTEKQRAKVAEARKKVSEEFGGSVPWPSCETEHSKGGRNA